MTLKITYPSVGRGAWSTGMRSFDGMKDGNQYRSTVNKDLPVIGEEVYQKYVSADEHEVTINDYAVWRGSVEIQQELKSKGFYNMTIDGRWGPGTDAAIKAWQTWVGKDFTGEPMRIDGVYGRQTARTMWQPRLLQAWKNKANGFNFIPTDYNISLLDDYSKATITLESSWDIAAVGYSTPRDNGFCQINTVAHKVTPAQAFNPAFAFNFKANLVLDNFAYAMGDLEIAMVSYNVGQGGAWEWHKAGRPKDWAAGKYLTALKEHVEHPRLVDALSQY